MNITMETQATSTAILSIDKAHEEFNLLVKAAVENNDATAALKAYAAGTRFKRAGDAAYEVALGLVKRFGASWGKSDLAAAFGVKPAAASVYDKIRDILTNENIEDDGTPLSDIASAVWAVHNQDHTGTAALSSAIATKVKLAKSGKIKARTVLSESDRLVKEAKNFGKEPKPELTPEQEVDAIIKRAIKVATDLNAITGAGYVLTEAQQVNLASAKALLA